MGIRQRSRNLATRAGDRRCRRRVGDFAARIGATIRIRKPASAVGAGRLPHLLLVLSLAGTISARDGSAAPAGMIGRGTVPSSSYRSALVNTPDPIDRTSSLAVTGNVAGGTAFRGNIAYGSATSFGAPLGSTAFDPFLRYSALPEAPSLGPPGVYPFYPGTGTVAKTPASSGEGLTLHSPRIAEGVMQSAADRPTDPLLAPATTPWQNITGRINAGGERTASRWVSPASQTSGQLRRIVLGGSDRAASERQSGQQDRQTMTPDEYGRQLEQLQRDLDRVSTRASEFEQDLNASRQPAVAPALTPRPAEVASSPVADEALRRIIQPRPQTPPPSSAASLSEGPASSVPPAAPIPEGLMVPGRAASRSAPGPGELTLLSPGMSAADAGTETSRQPGPDRYGSSQSPAASPSEWATPRQRIDAVFAPQTGGAADRDAAPDDQFRAAQRIDQITRTYEAPARLLEHPWQDSGGKVPSLAPAGREAATSARDRQTLLERPEAAAQPDSDPYRLSPGLVSSPSELAARRQRIDAIFAPQTGGSMDKGSGLGGPRPAGPRVDQILRPSDAPGRLPAQPGPDSAGKLPAATPDDQGAPASQDDFETLLRKAGASGQPYSGLYRPSSSPAALPSEPVGQKERIDALFAPQAEGSVEKSSGPGGPQPAAPRVGEILRPSEAPARFGDQPRPGPAGRGPAATPGDRRAAVPQDNFETLLRKAGASGTPYAGSYRPSASPAASPSEAGGQRERVDGVFTPQIEGSVEKGSGPGGPRPTAPRVDRIVRPSDARDGRPAQPGPGPAGSHPAAAPGDRGAAVPQDDFQTLLERAALGGSTTRQSAAAARPAPVDRPTPAAPPTPDPAARAKFDAYMASGQANMRQGQYGEAAESYALAALYNLRDARPHLGRSHALLAVGEYLGSAVCLAKAIELDPRLTLAESDLVEAAGGPDVFIRRVNDLQQRAKTSNAPGLQFLLAYVYQQTKAPELARTAIQAARNSLPSSKAVNLLAKAIEETASK